MDLVFAADALALIETERAGETGLRCNHQVRASETDRFAGGTRRSVTTQLEKPALRKTEGES